MLITFHSRFPTRLFAADGGGSGTGDDDDPDERVRSEDIINRSASDKDTIARLGRELDRNEDRRFKLRDSRRALQQQITDLQSKLPADGTVVLNADQAKLWETYQGLGKPEDVSKAIKERDEYQGELTTFRRNDVIKQAAEAHGYKPSALGKLPSLNGKQIEVREVEVEGQKAKRAFVKDGDKETGLTEFIQERDAEFLPALAADGGGTNTQRQNGQGGPRYPTQQNNNSQQRQPQNAGAAHVQRTKYAVPGKEK